MKGYLIRIAVVVGVLVLVIEGFFLYQLSQNRGDTSDAGTNRVASQYASEAGSSGQGSAESSDFAYVHRVTPENTLQNSTYLDNPLINGNPDAVIHVTQNWNPETGTDVYNDHLTGVWYDADAGQWAIFNQDRAVMPEGAAFNVFISETE